MAENGKRGLRPFPKDSLEEALAVAQTIQENGAGKPMKRLLLADGMNRKPNSSDFTYLLSSSNKYGLTTGNEKSEFVSLTDLGQSITKPTSESEKISGLQQAAVKPDIFKKVYEQYKDAKVPAESFFKNVLERQFSVPHDWVDECYLILMRNAKFSGILRDITGSPFFMLGDTSPTLTPSSSDPLPTENKDPGSGLVTLIVPPSSNPNLAPKSSPATKRIFVAHGKNKVPLEQLKKILAEFKIAYTVAIDEPNKGRPISEKVAELMHECTSAIFIFTGDEETYDSQGTKIYRPSDNVVYELGAANVLYGKKIIIFKEDGLDFASDFSDFGHISFEKDRLDAKTLDLLKELVAFGAVSAVAS
jgi:hypothetical protein